MNRKGWIVSLVLALSPAAALAQGSGFGLGIIVGEPTGLCGKSWLSHRTAFDFAAAWSFADESALHLHADFLMHRFDLIDISEGQLPVYYGIGGRLKFSDGEHGDQDARLGLRIPVGLAYLFEEAPLDLFVEVVPLLDLVPDTDFNLNASIGIRYFFH